MTISKQNGAKGKFKQLILGLLHSELPVPSFLNPFLKGFYRVGVFLREAGTLVLKWFIIAPLFRAIATEVGPNLYIERLPYIRGSGAILIGASVRLSGKIGILFSRHSLGSGVLEIGDRTFVGHGCSFSVAKEVRIGEDCLIAGGVVFADNDGHPLDESRRVAGLPVEGDEIGKIEISDRVWIGAGARILKGATIGEGAIVAAGSIVTKEVAPRTLVAGVPAKLIKRLESAEVSADQ